MTDGFQNSITCKFSQICKNSCRILMYDDIHNFLKKFSLKSESKIQGKKIYINNEVNQITSCQDICNHVFKTL